MVYRLQPIILGGTESPLNTIVALLDYYRAVDHYAYERSDTWYIGIGNHASLILRSDGETITKIDRDGASHSLPVSGMSADHARDFISQYSSHGKIFGQVGFNYSAHTSKQTFQKGKWPMMSLMVPCTQAVINKSQIVVSGIVEEEMRILADLIQSILSPDTLQKIASPHPYIELEDNSDGYETRVANAIAEMRQGKYTKAIPSRKVSLPFRVDMPATLFHGRQANNPARTFALSHMGIQAVGFSPEVLLSIKDQHVFTEALAGTQLVKGSAASLDPWKNKLLNDPKEVIEHAIAIKGSIRRLSSICAPESIAVKEFMIPVQRGSVQHLFSQVFGQLSPGRDGWDALPGLIANITVPGLPKQANFEAIRCFEPEPRELYCGAVLMIDEAANLFEATLVLRTVFQDESHQWLQAGAGVTVHSNPEREFIETCEKLGTVLPYIVAEE